MAGMNAVAPVYADDTGDDLYLPDRRPKKDTRSKLQRSKEAAAGMIVNACQFGCEDEDLDAEQYCRHLVGFTDSRDPRIFFPFKWRTDKDGNVVKRHRFVDGSDPQVVQAGDILVQYTTAARVYRDVDAETPSAQTAVALDKPTKPGETNASRTV